MLTAFAIWHFWFSHGIVSIVKYLSSKMFIL
jgi:hypothetical protein